MKPCIACGKHLPDKPLFFLQNAPASAQDIPDRDHVEQDKGISLKLYQCQTCGLVQFDGTPVSYYRDVIRAGGYSTTMTELRRRQYAHLIQTYHLEGKRFLEVGCGRGEFLKVLTEFPVEAYGIEHKEDLVAIARGDGLTVWSGFPEQAEQSLGSAGIEGPFDVFLSFNFLEHQPRPDVMLQAIYHNLTADGMGLVTVPALEYILDRGTYYELIRDHIAYYSFETLRTLLQRNGFFVLKEEMINRDTISMIVKKNPKWNYGVDTVKTDVVQVNAEPLAAGYDRVCRELTTLAEQLKLTGKKLAIWGASHQGFTLASTAQMTGYVKYIIDSAPFKQGRYAPASHLPIVGPEHYRHDPVDAILIVAPGYTEEIAGVIRERFGEAVAILTLRTDHIEEL